MARRKKSQNSSDLPPTDDAPMEIVLTSEHMKMVQGLIFHMQKIKMEQEALSEDIKAVAQKTNLKPAEVKEMVNWIIQEQEKGGVIDAKERKLDFIRQVLSFFDKAEEA